MIKQLTVLIALIGSVLFLNAQKISSSAKKLNVVFLLVDDMGWADVGYEGSSFYETPNIDALAHDGLVFNRAYAACPVCSPSRASIMTGKYPQRTGITDYINESTAKWDRNTRLLPAANKLYLDTAEVLLPEVMKAAGYKTYFAGKWHLGNKGFYPQAQGFDINKGGSQAGHPKSYFSPYSNPSLADGPEGEYLPERLTSETCRFIHENKTVPFFVYHSFYLVHTPLQAKASMEAKYQRKRDSLGLKDDVTEIGPDVFHKMPYREVRTVQSHVKYAAMVEALDEAVGKIIRALKQEGLYENTLIIFTSDNGGLSTSEGMPTSNLPLKGGKGYMYEGGIREPLIIRWPGVTKAGSKTDAVAWGPDFYPTIAAIAKAKIPATVHLDGQNLVPVIKDHANNSRTLFWHYPHYGNQGGGPASCIMEGDWKLIYWYDYDKYELFNVKNDQEEKNNLLAKEPRRVQDLKMKLEKWLKSVDAKYPTENPSYKAGK